MVRMCAAVLLFACALPSLSAAEPRALEYEVQLIRLRSKQIIHDAAVPLSGTELKALIPQWRERGIIERLTTMRVSSLEQQAASVQLGEEKTVTVGRTMTANREGRGGFGGFQSAVQMEQIGTMVTLNGAIADDGIIKVELSSQQTLFDSPGETAALPSTPEGASAPASPVQPSKTLHMTRTTLSLKSGEPNIAGGSWSEHKSGTQQTFEGYFVLVTATAGK